MTRVLVVQRFTRLGAPQDQQRGPIYAPLFRAAGIDARYIGRHPIASIRWDRSSPRLGRLLRRSLEYEAWRRVRDAVVTAVNDARILRAAREADAVLLLKVGSPSFVRRLRTATRARLVYDLADVQPHGDARRRAEVDEILGMVDAVTADNEVTLGYARERNDRAHLWSSTAYVEDFDRERASSRRGRDGRVVLGWVGTPSTAANLYLVLESLEDVFRAHPDLHLRLVGVPDDHELLERFERTRASAIGRYDAPDLVREVLGFDVGLFPAFDLDAAAIHGITKAVIYMGGGAVAVCSPVGAVPALVTDRVNGMLAASRAEWTSKLDELIRDEALRRALSEAGLATARSGHSLRACFEQLRGALGV